MRGKWQSIFAVLTLASAAAAQPTALTYQGRLRNGGQPASGLHDLRFRLFDAAQGGTQLGDTQCVNNVTVADGLFTASIDFGQQFASPDQRFLEIQVREDTGKGCNDGSGFTTLNPRQPLTAAPVASHANSAFALDAADGGPSNALIVDSEGRVGIGTATPQATLQLRANQDGDAPGEGIRIQGTSGGADNASYISFVNGSGIRIGYVGDGGGSDNNIFLNSDFGDVLLYSANSGPVLTAKANGNVGIGTTTPAARLEVRGDIRLGSAGELRAAGGEESLRVIRGTVSKDGQIIAGSGFTVFHAGTGDYGITFTTPFTKTPTVTATVEYIGLGVSTPIWPMADAVSPGKANIVIQFYIDLDEEGFIDRQFNFIAVGPR